MVLMMDTYCLRAKFVRPFTKYSAADWTRESLSSRDEMYLSAPIMYRLSPASEIAEFACSTESASLIYK